VESKAKILTANEAARWFRVPVAWLKAEANAGRLPHIRAGKVYLFSPDAVELTLAELAARPLQRCRHD
jgi:hypothetical protein